VLAAAMVFAGVFVVSQSRAANRREE
jgi:hypothetical protein